MHFTKLVYFISAAVVMMTLSSCGKADNAADQNNEETVAVSTLSAEEINFYQTAANEKAESVYGAALVHCLTTQTMFDEKVESGRYKFDFSKELNSDMSLLELSVCNRMYSEDVNITSGYAVVEISNGFADVAYFCEEDCFGDDYESFDPSLVNSQEYIVGIYSEEDKE